MSSLKYLLAITVIAAAAAAWNLLPSDAKVAAYVPITRTEVFEVRDAATAEMIGFALNLRTASEYTVYARKGIVDNGRSEVRGRKGDARRSSGRKTGRELADSIHAIRQLPCTDLNGGALSGRSFTSGVYCIGSGELDGTMVLDGQGDPAGIFIFRIAGALNVKDASEIELRNDAQGGSVYFVAESIEVGAGAVLRANLMASGNIKIGSGAVVTEKVMALGKAELSDSSILGGTTGTMRICNQQPLPAAPANDISDRVFHYVVTGAVGTGTAGDPVRVAIGACSEPFDVTAGPQTVTELNTGTLVAPSTGTFEGNFELVDVANLTPESPSSLGLVNLATRVASVNVAAGDASAQITLRFTNRHAITGFVEICARAATGPRQHNPAGTNPLSGGDPDVTGFFQYTVTGVYTVSQQNPNVRTLQVFTIPAGQCTGPIAVTKGDPPPSGGTGQMTTATMSMLPRAGLYFESADVFPVGRRNGPDVKGAIIGVDPSGSDVYIPAPGGGYVDVNYPAAASPEYETLAVFTIRSNPARLKVCKIAGPGIPINTLFRFTVTGIGALNPVHPQSAQYGTVTRTLDVRAGDPAQGGTCEFVPGFGANPQGYDQFQTFINGTPISIVENGISPNNTIPQNDGQLRNSVIRLFGTTFVNSAIAGYAANPDLTPTPQYAARASVFAKAGNSEVEFVGFRFNPAALKICNRAYLPNLEYLVMQFRVEVVQPQIGGAYPGPMFPAFSQTITLSPGPVGSPEGNCASVDGSTLIGGAFNQGSTIKITAQILPYYGSQIVAIECPTCGPGGLSADLPTRTAILSGPSGLGSSVNSVIFTTSGSCFPRPAESPGQTNSGARDSCYAPKRLDFDGDGRSDPAVVSPGDQSFSVALSTEFNAVGTFDFGIAGDRAVPADYDRDGTTDLAVWRPGNGTWYIAQSSGFTAVQWGQPGDIPQTGDFDGDRRSDFVVFRPSEAVWYVRTALGELYAFQFGIPTDMPYAADYDGDGRADPAVFRDGMWYLLGANIGFRAISFGQAGDQPVPEDYDADGRTDIAVYRNKIWYVLRPDGHYHAVQFGTADALPVPADYDGDGKSDLAYYRPVQGKWYIRPTVYSETGLTIITLGSSAHLPLQYPGTIFGRGVTTIF